MKGKTFDKTKGRGEFDKVKIHLSQCSSTAVCLYFTNPGLTFEDVLEPADATAFFDIQYFKEFVTMCQEFLKEVEANTQDERCWSCGSPLVTTDGICDTCGTPIQFYETSENYEYYNANL